MREEDSRSRPVRENMRLQYAFWAWERAVWAAMAVTVLLALSGILGHGPLSKATITDAGLALNYERFQRVTYEANKIALSDALAAGEPDTPAEWSNPPLVLTVRSR